METQAEQQGGEARRSQLMELSNAMVRLYKEQFGRGPTKTRSEWAGRDAVVCTLEDSLTPAERALVDMGEHQRMRDTRMFFQYASEDKFVEAAERITGRKVRAFISGIDTKKDVSLEMFYFEPSDSPSP
jgi:uncharacterized protein YbcI